MKDPTFLFANILFVLAFWGVSFWLFFYRDRYDELNKMVPIMNKQREPRLYQLFPDQRSVLSFALWPFFVGTVFFVLMVVNFLK